MPSWAETQLGGLVAAAQPGHKAVWGMLMAVNPEAESCGRLGEGAVVEEEEEGEEEEGMME